MGGKAGREGAGGQGQGGQGAGGTPLSCTTTKQVDAACSGHYRGCCTRGVAVSLYCREGLQYPITNGSCMPARSPAPRRAPAHRVGALQEGPVRSRPAGVQFCESIQAARCRHACVACAWPPAVTCAAGIGNPRARAPAPAGWAALTALPAGPLPPPAAPSAPAACSASPAPAFSTCHLVELSSSNTLNATLLPCSVPERPVHAAALPPPLTHLRCMRRSRCCMTPSRLLYFWIQGWFSSSAMLGRMVGSRTNTLHAGRRAARGAGPGVGACEGLGAGSARKTKDRI